MIKGIHESKARKDIDNKVFTRRWFCEPLFCCIGTVRPRRNFLQMLKLQPNMMNISSKVYDNQNCKNTFMETKKDKKERIAETTKATAHVIEMAM